jgi:hypothetical protein
MVGLIWSDDRATAQNTEDTLTFRREASPPALMTGAETTVILALTGRQAALCVGQPQPVDVVLVLDSSSSMGRENKIDAAKDAARQFIARMDRQTDRVAIVSYTSSAVTYQSLTHDLAAAQQALQSFDANDNTVIWSGLSEAVARLAERRPDASASIVLLSDGLDSRPNDTERLATEIKAQGICIYTISLGSDADRALMERIASLPSHHYVAPSAAALSVIYQAIRQRIAKSVATNILVFISWNQQALDLVDGSLSPAGVTNGNHITWTVQSIAAGQEQAFSFRVRPLSPGTYPASLSAGVVYYACGNQPRSFAQGPGAPLQVSGGPVWTRSPVTGWSTVTPMVSGPSAGGNLCPGPFGVLCNIFGLPWWVCLLLSLLVLLALLLWSLLHRPRKVVSKRPAPLSPFVPPAIAVYPTLETSPTPGALGVISTLPESVIARRTLVIGLGGSGRDVVRSLDATLRETYGHIPAGIRLLTIDSGIPESAPTDGTVYLLLDDSVYNLVKTLDQPGGDLPQIRAWWPLPGTLSEPLDPRDNRTGRLLRRLALFVHQGTLRRGLSQALCDLRIKDGRGADIYLVGSLAGDTGTGLLSDVAHLTQDIAQEEQLGVCPVYGLLLLPEAFPTGGSLEAEGALRRITLATWRELNRFQATFDYSYPMRYLDAETWQQGRLFGRCYLISPDRGNGPSLTGIPGEKGIYPALADVILTLLDPKARQGWEEIQRGVDSRLADCQRQRHEALYQSIGAFTYVFPVEDVVKEIAARLARELVAAQRKMPLSDPPVGAFLAQTKTPSGVVVSDLIRRIPQYADQAKAVASAVELGTTLASLLPFGPQEKSTLDALQPVRELTSDYLLTCVLTSDQFGAEDYNQDTLTRFLKDVNRELARGEDLDVWAQGCVQNQVELFGRLLNEYLGSLLRYDPARPDQSGLGPVRAFLKGLETVISGYHATVHVASQQAQQVQAQRQSEADQARGALQQAAESGPQQRHPNLVRTLLEGQGIPAMAVILLGVGAALNSALLLPAGIGAGLAVLAGGLWSYFALFRKRSLIQLQATYRAEAQALLEANLTLALYQSWEQISQGFVEKVARSSQPLAQWDAALGEQGVLGELSRIEADLANRRQERSTVQVRRYLDTPDLVDRLYQNYLGTDVLPAALGRIVWQGNSVTVAGSQVWDVAPEETVAVTSALWDLAQTYAGRLRQVHIADILAANLPATALAEEAGPKSAPFIRLTPNEQPEFEEHRFVCVHAGDQETYFASVIAGLRKPVASHHTQQQVAMAHAYRCSVLTSLDLIRPAGLPIWVQSSQAYQYLPSRERSLLHIFPAEVHAARWEGSLQAIRLPLRLFSPFACLTLDNERRARAFWLAYGYGWVREEERLSGVTSDLGYVLNLPGATPAWLCEPRRGISPSLWDAAASFVLGIKDHPLTDIEKALGDKIATGPDATEVAKRHLEEAIAQAVPQLRDQGDARSRELGILFQLILEDTLRRLYKETPLFAHLPDLPGVH